MEINKKNETVVVRYQNGKISIYNEDRTIGGVLEITSNELRKMYFGDDGVGILHLQVVDTEDE